MNEHIAKYNAAIALFASEGQIQWSRYSAMLIVNTIFITIIGFAQNPENKELPPLFVTLSPFAPILGITICILWFRMTEKGFIWMKHWISSARQIEERNLRKEVNPILNGRELRNTIGGDTTQNASYLVIGIFIFIYLSILISNFTK